MWCTHACEGLVQYAARLHACVQKEGGGGGGGGVRNELSECGCVRGGARMCFAAEAPVASQAEGVLHEHHCMWVTAVSSSATKHRLDWSCGFWYPKRMRGCTCHARTTAASAFCTELMQPCVQFVHVGKLCIWTFYAPIALIDFVSQGVW